MKSKIMITIDAETGEKASKTINGFNDFFIGKFGDKEFGAGFIAQILNRYNISADFFCNVYETKKYGEEKLENIITRLIQMNQQIQLHTHPGFYFDENRRNLYDYDLNEQIDIIKHGKELIYKWTGKNPFAHRAGMYSANDNTIEALNKNNVKADSSYLSGNSNCKLSDFGLNKISEKSNVIEFPITVIQNIDGYRGIPFPRKRISKLDINLFSPFWIYWIIKLLSRKTDYIMLFLHSSSFVKRNKYNKAVAINYSLISSFEILLQKLIEQGYDFVSMEQFSYGK